jgi:hypothetical protein
MSARGRDGLQSRRDIHAIVVDLVVLHDHIPAFAPASKVLVASSVSRADT